mgnify:CR=1 FL=1
MDHTRAPIYDRLVAHRERKTASFHVPGHKAGLMLDPAAAREFRAVMEIDLTEIPGLDDLHQPEGVIRDAERLAADVFGAERTFFLVGGSTAGLLALMLTVGSLGRPVIVQRNAHKSVINGLTLAGATAVFVTPRTDPASGLAGGVAASDLAEALSLYPDAAAVVLTNPNYYGMGVDLKPLVALAHARNVPVIVDEAHGAHYGQHPALPESALAAGADGVVQSTHKMLTAMTMGAMLHLGRGGRIDPDEVRRALRMVQSSSPSYPILASLDLCRRQLALGRDQLLGGAIRAAAELRKRLAGMPELRVLEAPQNKAEAAFTTLDPLKLTVSLSGGEMSGFALLDELNELGCVAELADPRHVLLALGPGTDMAAADRLADALMGICRRHRFGPAAKDAEAAERRTARHAAGNAGAPTEEAGFVPAVSGPVRFGLMTAAPGGRTGGGTERVPLDARKLAGRIAAEPIVPYPPGIPLVFTGERFTAEAVARLERWRKAGARVHGLDGDGRVSVFK